MFAVSATAALLLATASSVSSQSTTSFPDGVIATGTMGTTNPPEPTMPTSINQTSYARLLTVNSIDDWCIFAPPYLSNISDSETFEVAWCTQARNDARVIPDGTVTGVSLLKTDFYVQIMGYGDFTKLNIPYGDYGGELDPHGAYGSGNPVGGNVTTNITGSDINVAEWMLYVDYNQFCFRACTNANSTYAAEYMCWHELDEMGCEFVMPGNYNFNGTFETCQADVAYPPGWYPTATVSGSTLFSTFAQYWTGTIDGTAYTVGETITPSTAYSTPSSSSCVTVPTISNGIALESLTTGVSGSEATSGAAATASAGQTSSRESGSAQVSGTAGSSGSTTSTSSSSNAASHAVVKAGLNECVILISLVSGIVAVAFLH